MSRGRHVRAQPLLSLPRALLLAAAVYLLIGLGWYAVWVATGPPGQSGGRFFTYAILAPLLVIEFLVAWRYSERSVVHCVVAQCAVVACCALLGYLGILTGAFLGWLVLWTFLESRAVPWLGLWGSAALFARAPIRRAWAALA